jgi:hypothetical protein
MILEHEELYVGGQDRQENIALKGIESDGFRAPPRHLGRDPGGQCLADRLPDAFSPAMIRFCTVIA